MDKVVFIVEDIVDTGLTINYIINLLKERKPKEIKVCSLLDKPSQRIVDVDLDFVGFTIPPKFVIGYGLDYNEKYRNKQDILILQEGE
jgi:hypoxanthine phosphoribosyltransferase